MATEEAQEVIKTITLTREEMHKVAAERVAEIAREFTEGFKFLENYPRSVTFFGSRLVAEDHPDYQDARALSQRIVKELGYSVVSGGGPGVMEAADRGAFEAGGETLGLLVQIPTGQPVN